MKTLTFKTVSPLFEMERNGIKPFTCRRTDSKDSRFRALSQWQPLHCRWAIQIVNPATGETFTRKLIGVDYIRGIEHLLLEPVWKILYLGELIKGRDKMYEHTCCDEIFYSHYYWDYCPICGQETYGVYID